MLINTQITFHTQSFAISNAYLSKMREGLLHELHVEYAFESFDFPVKSQEVVQGC